MLHVPLSGRHGWLGVLTLRQRAAREAVSEDLRHRLERLGVQVSRLGTLVETLMDVSRLVSGELRRSPERFDLCELVREVAQRYAAEARSAGCPVRLELCGDVRGRWDRLRVDQAVASLLANALKFGPGQPVEVTVRRVDGGVRLEVNDRGLGVPEEQLERIFERFGRAVSSRSYGGLGLGLYLARRTAQAHGGRVWAGGRETPVVVFSASAGAREESEALGAQACLRKPVDVDTLLATVEKHAKP